MQLKPIAQQVVVVCGASSGIGREAALRFAERGAQVVVAARTASALESLVDEIRERGGSAVAQVADVAVFEQVQLVAERAISAFGRLDTWVHLAGVGLFATFEQLTMEEFQQVININLMGQVHGAKAALPYLKRDGGALIHISSMGAKRAIPLQTAYCASKHGIQGFVEAMRVEFQHDRVPISVTNIMPATLNTPFFDKARTKLGVKPVAPPPIYDPRIVVDAIIYAAEHPVRDLIVGGAAMGVIRTQTLSPRLLDAILRWVGYELHNTHVPKPENVPNSLFAPVEGWATVRGSFGEQTVARSMYTWLEIHPAVKRAVGGTLFGALALATMRKKR